MGKKGRGRGRKVERREGERWRGEREKRGGERKQGEGRPKLVVRGVGRLHWSTFPLGFSVL